MAESKGKLKTIDIPHEPLNGKEEKVMKELIKQSEVVDVLVTPDFCHGCPSKNKPANIYIDGQTCYDYCLKGAARRDADSY